MVGYLLAYRHDDGKHVSISTDSSSGSDVGKEPNLKLDENGFAIGWIGSEAFRSFCRNRLPRVVYDSNKYPSFEDYLYDWTMKVIQKAGRNLKLDENGKIGVIYIARKGELYEIGTNGHVIQLSNQLACTAKTDDTKDKVLFAWRCIDQVESDMGFQYFEEAKIKTVGKLVAQNGGNGVKEPIHVVTT